jgi:hypothetical protein
MSNLSKIFLAQKKYNEKIRIANGDNVKSSKALSYWTEKYILGMVSEFDEVLREIDWKKHRKSQFVPNRINIAYELSDLTKYILSLWELWGFEADDVIEYVDLKSRILELQSMQEFSVIPDGIPIVITDIDGTLGDWRTTFIDWLHSKGIKNIIEDPVSSLNLDLDLDMLYTGYSDLKEEFESSGKYREIAIYPDSRETLERLKNFYGAYIISVTARPSHIYRRIWMDTWIWIENNRLPVDQLKIGSESRIILAHELSKTHPVIMLEDNSSLLLRGANSGITIFGRRQQYNCGVSHRNLRLVDSFSEVETSEFFPDLQKSNPKESE